MVVIKIELTSLVNLLGLAFDRGSDFEINKGQFLQNPEEYEKEGRDECEKSIYECFDQINLDLDELIKLNNNGKKTEES